MTPLQFTWLDWGILGGYVVILAIASPWQLCIGTAVAILICLLGNQPANPVET